MEHYFITGTSRGLGKAIAEELLKRVNTRVTGISRSASIRHERYTHRTADLTDEAQIVKFKFHLLDGPEKIVLVNNAGMLGDIKYIGNADSMMLMDGIRLNLTAPLVLMNRFIQQYRETPCQKIIVNVSSGAATKPYDGWGMYCASKAGLKMITEVVAKEQSLDDHKHPFRVLSIAPGVVRTEMQEQIRRSEKDDFSMIDKFIGLHEKEHLYAPEDVAKKYVEILDDPDKVAGIAYRVEL